MEDTTWSPWGLRTVISLAWGDPRGGAYFKSGKILVVQRSFHSGTFEVR